MKIENVLIVGGLIFIGYWLLKKPKNKVQENVNKSPEDVLEDVRSKPRNLVLNLSDIKERPISNSNNGFYDEFLTNNGYNTSKFSTIAPAQVTVKRGFYDL